MQAQRKPAPADPEQPEQQEQLQWYDKHQEKGDRGGAVMEETETLVLAKTMSKNPRRAHVARTPIRTDELENVP
jgi:hypothetical protein